MPTKIRGLNISAICSTIKRKTDLTEVVVMNTSNLKKAVKYAEECFFILIGSALYAVGTVFFIFPHSLLLGGTSGISVILEDFVPFSPGTILTVINSLLIITAFTVLGKNAASKTLIGSVCTTALIALLERLFPFESPVILSPYASSVIGAAVIAVASGIMFYVGSSSGGTDIIALIIKRFFKINIGKALLATDILIVLTGGILSGSAIFISSVVGLLIKTLGIDLVTAVITKIKAVKAARR